MSQAQPPRVATRLDSAGIETQNKNKSRTGAVRTFGCRLSCVMRQEPVIRLEPRFAELSAMTNFSFLRGASHPEEMVARAAELGLAGIGIADRNTLAGVVRAHVFARENKAALEGMRVVPGARLSSTTERRTFSPIQRIARLTAASAASSPRETCARPRASAGCGGGSAGARRGPAGRGAAADLSPPPLSGRAREGGRTDLSREARSSPNRRARRDPPPRPSPHRGGGGRSRSPLLRDAFGRRLWIGASLTYGEDMRGALAGAHELSRKSSARRFSRPTTRSCTRPSGARSPTSSPAFARA